ncbi:MAG: class II D-tagatose-bisphosphate aldolase, non-catalytic subunit [Granulosicoccus sp.]
MYDIASLIDRNRSGDTTGLPCFCTANEYVLRAIMAYAAEHCVPAVIEATCNQVNQDGGYTGLTAADFSRWIKALANEYDVSPDKLILGGDHLGPNPWRHLPAREAMEKAEVLVRDYAAAGFRKIHLDASMACGGEPTPTFELVAERAARLCRVAEDNSPAPENLIYIIGTEVPVPGGETDDMADISVTTAARLHATIDTHQLAFDRCGLMTVWPRIASIVTQPGVDFSHNALHRFDPAKAIELSTAILRVPGMTFEAHSTDYQPTDALAELVEHHCFFLKVGPELTFRMREAVFALVAIEKHLLENDESHLVHHIDQAMSENPSHWTPYYQGDPDLVYQLRHFSYSDRVRYYWKNPNVRNALEKLIANLEKQLIPETIVSQYFPQRELGNLGVGPKRLISDHVNTSIDRYYKACGYRAV